MNIDNKVAVITGGASGLGQATAERILAAGGKVAIFDLDDQRGQAFADAHPGNAIYAKVNVADEASAEAGIAATIEAFGAIHICVNCAGIGGGTRIVGRKGPHSMDAFMRILNVNLVGTFNIIRLAAAQMLKNDPVAKSGERGVIVNTASIAAAEGQMGQVAYAASKAGVVGMTLPLTRDLAEHGVRVCAIMPGLFETPLVSTLPQEVRDYLVTTMEFPKRGGDPAEFAALVGHIIENPYLNGEVIRLDGGTRPPPR